ncbi:MAG: ABC transporter substrate-binding protein, partial [Proteobacteria bacterium]|nr:ABC transporter substrate-binding protein [Pseudomonadota bacterium]
MKKKTFGVLRLLALAVAVVTLSTFGIAGSVAAAGDSQWKWTAENPKPEWWTWGKDYWPTDPVRGGYFRRASFKYIGLMNPNHWPVHDWVAMSYLYGRLLYADGTHKPNVKWMAESWEFKGPTTAVLKLRKGIKFHDGSDFNAAAYKYQLEWMMNRKNGAWTRAGLEPVKKVEIVDEYTLKWHFKRPWAGFPGTMQFTQGACISAKALEKDGTLNEIVKLEKRVKTFKKKLAKYERKGKAKKADKTRKRLVQIKKRVVRLKKEVEGFVPLDKWAVGSGPFMVEEARPGNYLKLKRNPDWWFGKSIGRPEMPYFDGWKITVIPDISVQLANLRADKIDHISVDPSQYRLIKDDPSLNVRVSPQNDMHGLMINHTKKVFQDIRVRKAIAHAIDRKALIKGVHLGLGREAASMYPEDHWAHNPRLKPVAYNPELSRELLAQAGYKNGLGLKGYYWNYPLSLSEATAIKAMLKKVGIDWT